MLDNDMKTKFKIICPIARFENAPKIKNVLRKQNVELHFVSDSDNPKSSDSLADEPWVFHHICDQGDRTIFWDRSNNALNWYLDNQQIDPDSFYCFLNDDDAYEPEYFQKLRAIIENYPYEIFVVITSMARGDNIPKSVIGTNREHHNNTLIAHPTYMQPGKVGLEQIAVKGKVISVGNYRFPRYDCGDGIFITMITQQTHTLYVPEVFVWFNYFEPERWINSKVYDN